MYECAITCYNLLWRAIIFYICTYVHVFMTGFEWLCVGAWGGSVRKPSTTGATSALCDCHHICSCTYLPHALCCTVLCAVENICFTSCPCSQVTGSSSSMCTGNCHLCLCIASYFTSTILCTVGGKCFGTIGSDTGYDLCHESIWSSCW